MSDHDLSVGGVDVGRGVVLVDVAAVVVRERVLQPPRRPVLDVDDAAHTGAEGWRKRFKIQGCVEHARAVSDTRARNLLITVTKE